MSIFFSDEQDDPIDAEGLLDFAQRILSEEGLPKGTEMAVVFVGPDQMADYNQSFMDRPGPTDVLAFPVEDLVPGSIPRILKGEPPLSLGDVFICPAEVRKRAVGEGFDPDDFMYLIVVHGILHLLGYDHGNETEADRMERREDELLAVIGRKIS